MLHTGDDTQSQLIQIQHDKHNITNTVNHDTSNNKPNTSNHATNSTNKLSQSNISTYKQPTLYDMFTTPILSSTATYDIPSSPNRTSPAITRKLSIDHSTNALLHSNTQSSIQSLPTDTSEIITPQYTEWIPPKINKSRLQQLSSIECVDDNIFILRHSQLEHDEAQTRINARQVFIWSRCDSPTCGKWRLIDEYNEPVRNNPSDGNNTADDVIETISNRHRYYCGGKSYIQSIECSYLDDWIVNCIGVNGAELIGSHGIHSVDQLARDQKNQLNMKLHELGYYYEKKSQLIKKY